MLKKILFLLFFGLLLPASYKAQGPPSLKSIMKFVPSDLEKAKEMANKLLYYGVQNNIDSTIAKANYALGLIFYYQDQNIVSAKYFQNALKQAYAKKNIDFSEKCLNNLGVNYELIGKLDEALIAYQKSLNIAERRKDSFGIAQTWINIAMLKSKVGDYKNAMRLNKKAQAYFLNINDTSNLGLTYLNAAFFNNQFDKEKAIEELSKSKVLFESIRDTLNIIKIYSNLIGNYIDLKRYTEAEYYFIQAKNLSSRFETYGFKAYVLNNGIELYIKKKNLAAAKALLKETESNLLKYPNPEQYTQLLALKVKLNAYEGNLPAFEKSLKKYDKENAIVMRNNFTSDYEQWSIIYEKDELIESINKLSDVNKLKNKTIIVNSFIIIILIFILVLVAILYLKLRDSYKKLFQLNNMVPDKALQDVIIGDEDSNEQKLYLLFTEIQQLMEEEKFYLKPGITISDVSTALGTNDKYISLSVNKYARMNFNHYINTLRVQEAKKLLLEPSRNNSIQDIAMVCGFGNASSFIRVFKQITGLTPAYYVTLSKEMS
jgi:AraC-like DNA-binding protein